MRPLGHSKLIGRQVAPADRTVIFTCEALLSQLFLVYPSNVELHLLVHTKVIRALQYRILNHIGSAIFVMIISVGALLPQR